MWWASATDEERQAVGQIGDLGGRARAKKLTPKRRSEIAPRLDDLAGPCPNQREIAPPAGVAGIGLRQAVGAKTKDILTQFLVEAVTLSLLGGIAGILLGMLASKLISIFAQWSTLISPGAILLAFVFSALVGVFFGFYPARKAALLDPIDALRYE